MLYVEYRYGIHEEITVEKFTNLYGGLLNRVEAIYELDSELEISEAVSVLKAELPSNLGILRLAQRDKGITHVSYGKSYFYFNHQHYSESYFYTSNQIRRVSGLMRGYVKTQRGRKNDALQYRRIVHIDGQELDIELIVDYQTVLKLSRVP
jgi:hypothetical protein